MSELVEGRKATAAELAEIAKASKEALRQIAQTQGRNTMIYLHWSAGHYHQFYDDYHINIDDDGSIYLTTNDLSEIKAHTWHRNSGAVGVSLACAAFATSVDLANEPPTGYQIESMAQTVALPPWMFLSMPNI